MSTAPNTDNYTLGKGIVYFDREDADGNQTGNLDLGNAPNFAVTITSESLEHFESRSGIREMDRSVETMIRVQPKFTLDEINIDNMLLALLGDDVEYLTQASGSQTDVVITARHDKYSELQHRSVDNVVVTDTTGVTTYTEDTDYTVNYEMGWVKALSTGSISDGETLHVDYDHNALQYPKVVPVKRTPVVGKLRFVGDPAVGNKLEFVLWRVRINATGDINFITEDWQTIEFEGNAQKDVANHSDEPWGYLLDKTTNESAGS